jgi:hypothetical protein
MKTMMLVAMVVAGCNGGGIPAKQPQCSVTFGSPAALVASTSTALVSGIQIDGPADGSCNVEPNGEMTMVVAGFSFTAASGSIEVHDNRSGVDCTTVQGGNYYPSKDGGDWTFDVMCGGQRIIGAAYWSVPN